MDKLYAGNTFWHKETGEMVRVEGLAASWMNDSLKYVEFYKYSNSTTYVAQPTTFLYYFTDASPEEEYF